MTALSRRLRCPRYAPTAGSYADRGMVVVVLTPDDARTLAEMYGPRDDAYKELLRDADTAEQEWYEL